MKVLVTGATGFTGSFVIPVLLERGLQVRCFVRPTSDLGSLPRAQVELAQGGFEDPESLRRALGGIDALVNVASLGFGHAPSIVQAAEEARCQRAIFISTTAIFTSLNAPSKSARTQGEEAVRKSSLDFTILRPTMIYGSPRDRNMWRLIRYVRRWPVIPVFGSGNYLQQPVFVKDVADAIAAALTAPSTIRKSYNIPGQNALTYNQVINTICELLGRTILRLHFPPNATALLLRTAERLNIHLPLKAEQVLRLNEHKAFDFAEATHDFGYQPRTFRAGIAAELEQAETQEECAISR